MTEAENEPGLNFASFRKMPENRPNDALGTLVKLVRCCNCKYISHFDIVRYLINFVRYQNETFRIVQTVQNIFDIVRYMNNIVRLA